MHIDTLNRIIENERVVLRGVSRNDEPSICCRCADTGEIWVEKDNLRHFLEEITLRYGARQALEDYHYWKHNRTLPCPECRGGL